MKSEHEREGEKHDREEREREMSLSAVNKTAVKFERGNQIRNYRSSDSAWPDMNLGYCYGPLGQYYRVVKFSDTIYFASIAAGY